MKRLSAHILIAVLALLVVTACSTKKNTATTRFYHATTARFNTYYNGHEAYKEGLTAQENSHQDDYTTLLPMYIVADKKTQGIGKGNYERAIEKCEKAIKRHSIKRRPVRNVSKKLTDKERAFYARKEFNPFLKNAWLLMGKAQFQQGNFIEAASIFNYIIRLYATQPEVVSVARAYLARCYVQLEWPYDAEDVFNKIKRDTLTKKGAIERDASYANYLILTEQYKEAIPYLKKTIKKENRKKLRARLNFLLAQLYRAEGQNSEAYKSLKRVIRSNPPYELALNARVMQSEVMSKGQYKRMIKRLQRMAKSDKNKEYLDQVYYAIGNIYLSVQDTVHCIGAYQNGIDKSTRNGIAKAVLLMRLGDIYWQQEKYVKAQTCYADLMGILDKEHEEYKESHRRSEILNEVAPHIAAVELQDSLQALAKMPESERLAAIDRVIEELKRKEKEEAKKAAALNGGAGNSGATGSMPPTAGQAGTNRGANAATNMGGRNQGAWYFYNPTAVMQGKNDFRRRWGNRANEDNWRRSDKGTVMNSEFAEYNYDEESDSLSADGSGNGGEDILSEEEQARLDSIANDPHEREYYLRQIPFTEEQLQSSNQLLSDGLYNSGILEMEKLENFPLADRTLTRLLTDFPDYTSMDNVYYHLFLLNGRKGDVEKAQLYRAKLIEEFPSSKYALLLKNPNYELYAKHGKHIEDSLYAATYAAYQQEQYDEVERNYQLARTDFPEGTHLPKFIFIRAMSQLYAGQRDTFLTALKEVISKYPKNEVSELANYIVKGVKEGRLLNDNKFDIGNLWSRRERGEESDSIQQRVKLSDERFCNFVFMLAYPENSLDENQLLFEMARYNFTNFMVRNFDIEIVKEKGISELILKGFLSFDEVHAYTQKLYGDPHMKTVLDGIRVVIISEDNLRLLGTAFSFDDYKAFYDEHFAPLEIPEDLRLDEAEVVEPMEEEEDAPEQGQSQGTTDDDWFENFMN